MRFSRPTAGESRLATEPTCSGSRRHSPGSPGDTDELLDRLDASRARRNEASYAAGFIAAASLEDAFEATTELVERAQLVV
jgi:hypothetical protein